MSRRALGTAALAAGLLTTGLVPFLGSASAAACPAWTDVKGDATTNNMPIPGGNDANMDIVAATLGTSGSNIVATITVDDLTDPFSDIGDRFTLQLDLAGAKLRLLADRDLTGKYAEVDNITGSVSGAATAAWDIAKNTITITAPQAEVDKAAGRATKGEEAVVVAAGSSIQANGDDAYSYDSSLAPAGTKYVVGAACGGTTPEPTTSPTPTPTPTTPGGALPDGYPTAGCYTFGDVAGDGKVTLISAPAQLSNDPDMDVLGLAIGTTATNLEAYFRVEKLAMPKNRGGHIFTLTFTAGGKVVELQAGEGDAVDKSIEGTWGSPTYGTVDGGISDDIVVTAKFDKTNNFVVVSAPLAGIAKAVAAPLSAGTKLTSVFGTSAWMWTPLQGTVGVDTVQAAAVADRVYTVGNSPCFGPPPGVLANRGATSVQYTDAAALAAKLTGVDGAALAGRTVRFAIGAKSVTAKTGSDGVAKASLNPGLAAGSYSLVTSFAGDSNAGEVTLTTPFSVVAEKTRIVLTVVKSGTKRTVTAKLLDDDGRPVAGQTITWYVNGKKVTTSKTTSAGLATLKTAKPTQTVKADFATVTGKLTGSTASKKV
jgi:hypothetical protein